jgi:glycosyltransferase involved in cell wall biosynthesis
LKLAFVTSFPDDPKAPHGGVEAVSVNLVKALAEFDDLDIDVVTTKQDCSRELTEEWGKVRIHRLAWAGGSMLGNAIGPGRRQMQEFLRKINPDVIHAHDTYGLLVKGLPVPRVFTIHGFIYGDVKVSGTRFASLRWRLWKLFETSGWKDQKHIISISPYVRQRLSGIAKGKIYEIDNPVSESCFDIKRNERKNTIFCAAAVIPRKNILILIEAIEILVNKGFDIELRLAGSLGDEIYVRKVHELIDRKKLEKKVLLLGSLSSEQIQDELSEASVFALVSLEENSPIGIEEAMAAGVPVVTSNRCGMPYMVSDCKSGFLVDPENPYDIAMRLEHLLVNDKLRESFGSEGKKIAMERFHPEKVAKLTMEVYLRAIEEYKRK